MDFEKCSENLTKYVVCILNRTNLVCNFRNFDRFCIQTYTAGIPKPDIQARVTFKIWTNCRPVMEWYEYSNSRVFRAIQLLALKLNGKKKMAAEWL